MNQFFIYGLADPDTKIIRYVGQTNNLKKRLDSHMTEMRSAIRNGGRVNRKNAWLMSLNSRGVKPDMIPLTEADTREKINDEEIRIIAELLDCGFDLTNGDRGGNRTTEITEAHKKNLSKVAMGRKASDETKLKMSQTAKRIARENPELTQARIENLRISNQTLIHPKGDECTFAKLTEQDVIKIRKELKLGKSLQEVAKQYPENTKTAVHAAGAGKSWVHVAEEPFVPRKKVKLTPKDIIEIREMLSKGIYQQIIADKFNVNNSLISMIKTGKRYPLSVEEKE